VTAVAVVVDAAAVDAASFRGCFQVVDSGKIAPAVAANTRGLVNGSVQVACVRSGSYVVVYLSSLGLGP
jgi:hypothetical protein